MGNIQLYITAILIHHISILSCSSLWHRTIKPFKHLLISTASWLVPCPTFAPGCFLCFLLVGFILKLIFHHEFVTDLEHLILVTHTVTTNLTTILSTLYDFTINLLMIAMVGTGLTKLSIILLKPSIADLVSSVVRLSFSTFLKLLVQYVTKELFAFFVYHQLSFAFIIVSCELPLFRVSIMILLSLNSRTCKCSPLMIKVKILNFFKFKLRPPNNSSPKELTHINLWT